MSNECHKGKIQLTLEPHEFEMRGPHFTWIFSNKYMTLSLYSRVSYPRFNQLRIKYTTFSSQLVESVDAKGPLLLSFGGVKVIVGFFTASGSAPLAPCVVQESTV